MSLLVTNRAYRSVTGKRSTLDLCRAMEINLRSHFGAANARTRIDTELNALVLDESPGVEIRIATSKGRWSVAAVVFGSVRGEQFGYGHRVPEMVEAMRTAVMMAQNEARR